MQAERYNAICVQSICPANSRKERSAIKRWFLVLALHFRAVSSQVRNPRITSRSIREKVSFVAVISFSNGCIPIRMCKQPIQFIFGKAFVEHFPGCYKFWKG